MLWTKLTNPKDIERALRERARYREGEERGDIDQHSAVKDKNDSKEFKEEETTAGVTEAEHQPTEFSRVRSADESTMTQANLVESNVVLNNARNAFVTPAEVDAMIKSAVNNDVAPSTGNVYNVHICSHGCSIM